MSRLLRVILVLSCLGAGLACPAAVVRQTPAAPTGASGPAVREWRLRVALDSGEVHVSVTTRAASVAVVAATGTFQQSFETAGPLADWAGAAETLPPPRPAPPSSRAGRDSVPAAQYTSVRLAEPVDTARRFDLTEYQLTRVGADSAPEYLLSGTNGVWGFVLRVGASQAAALLGALRGELTPGAVPYEFPREGRTPAEHTPLVTGAYLVSQVTRSAEAGRRPPRAAFPAALVGTGQAGSVRLQFIVEADGRVRPSSVRLIGKAHPAFAAAARDALLAAQYRPAVLGGRPVPELNMQSFDFQRP